MFCLGLTGMIASGKSTASQVFKDLGAFVISADTIAREITETDQAILSKIRIKFGEHIMDKNGKLKRTELRNIIFNDLQAKKWLEDLLHPLIRHEIEKKLTQATSNLVVIEIPLLHDRKLFPYLEKVLLITTNKATQIRRIMQRDNCNQLQAKQIINSQANLATYKKVADITISNNKSTDHLTKEIEKLYQEIQKQLTIT